MKANEFVLGVGVGALLEPYGESSEDESVYDALIRAVRDKVSEDVARVLVEELAEKQGVWEWSRDKKIADFERSCQGQCAGRKVSTPS